MTTFDDTMSEIQASSGDEAERLEAVAVFAKADLACTFGPSFFLGHLGRFVRDRCPDPKENRPVVQVRLGDGETLDVCHIIAVSPRWVMLAVRDAAGPRDGMAVELVPYGLVQRICIRTRTRRAEGGSIGFTQTRPPEIIAPETPLQAAMMSSTLPDP